MGGDDAFKYVFSRLVRAWEHKGGNTAMCRWFGWYHGMRLYRVSCHHRLTTIIFIVVNINSSMTQTIGTRETERTHRDRLEVGMDTEKRQTTATISPDPSNGNTDRQIDRPSDRQTDRQANRQTDRQTYG